VIDRRDGMAGSGITRIRELFRPEEVAGRNLVRPEANVRLLSLSLKAVFWCAAAIGISLAIGNLV
jgi:hypothetical protein